jgi:hypothetical protein
MMKAAMGALKHLPMPLQISAGMYVAMLFLFGKKALQISRPDFSRRGRPGASSSKHRPATRECIEGGARGGGDAAGNKGPVGQRIVPGEGQEGPPGKTHSTCSGRDRGGIRPAVDEGFILLADRRGKSPFHTNRTLGECAAQRVVGYENTGRKAGLASQQEQFTENDLFKS